MLLVLLQCVQRIWTNMPALDSSFVTCNSFLARRNGDTRISGAASGAEPATSSLEERQACRFPLPSLGGAMQMVHLRMQNLPSRFHHPFWYVGLAVNSVKCCGRTLATNRGHVRFASNHDSRLVSMSGRITSGPTPDAFGFHSGQVSARYIRGEFTLMCRTLAFLALCSTAFAQTPTVTAVYNGYSYSATLCPGLVAVVTGTNFGTNGSNVTVNVGTKPAYVYTNNVSSTAIPVEIPFELSPG